MTPPKFNLFLLHVRISAGLALWLDKICREVKAIWAPLSTWYPLSKRNWSELNVANLYWCKPLNELFFDIIYLVEWQPKYGLVSHLLHVNLLETSLELRDLLSPLSLKSSLLGTFWHISGGCPLLSSFVPHRRCSFSFVFKLKKIYHMAPRLARLLIFEPPFFSTEKN